MLPPELTPERRRRAIIASTAFVLASVLFAVCAGPDGLGLDFLHDSISAVLVSLRYKRIFLGAVAGAALAATGAALQALLRNALADPYIIGVSGGAAIGGALVLATGWASAGLSLSVGSFAGALFASAGLGYFVSRLGTGRNDAALLAGVVFNSFAAAVLTLIKTLLPADRAYTLLYWLVGNIAYVKWDELLPLGCITLLALIILFRMSGHIELLALGPKEALRMGVPVRSVELIVYALASLLVALTVPLTGMIGFVGLIVPHGLRLLIGPDQRLLLPVSALVGAGTLVFFDAVARLSFLWLHTELPVGALTAIFGAPLFGLALLRNRSGEDSQ